MNRRQTKLPAHEKLNGKNKMLKRLAQGKMARLLEELKTQQAKLEMQNEELRETQARLEKFGNRYSNLYHGAPIGDFIFDCDGAILEVNPAGAEHLGGSGIRSLISPSFSIFLKKTKSAFAPILRRFFRTAAAVAVKSKSKEGTASSMSRWRVSWSKGSGAYDTVGR
ncbi:MAG: hypothetical protein MPW16_10430 [Candidatus Manganitrophus sp.]|nr:MAG: hypothetical protein MPW16_10430 [Candidatus Manganitrophus sp.]